MQLNRSKEQGLVYLPILIAVVALIGFILVSSSTDLKDKLFSTSVVKEAKAQTTPFVCTACAADVNKDGNVNTRDFSILKACTNKPATGLCAKADINGDGVIDDKDLNCWKSQHGKQCKP